MTTDQYRRRWLRLQKAYEKRAFTIFRKGFQTTANKVPWDNLQTWNYVQLIEANIPLNALEDVYFDAYFLIGFNHGQLVGKSINKDTKAFIPETFSRVFRNLIIEFLKTSLGQRITSVRQSLIAYLIEEIEKGIREGLDVRKIASNMKNLVNSRSFYRWQALRIARTETTAAANYGAISAAEESSFVIEKIWISGQDARVRRRPKSDYDHLELNGTIVAQNALFEDNGAFLLYPGDPSAPAGAVINCRCSVNFIPKRDAMGRLVPK